MSQTLWVRSIKFFARVWLIRGAPDRSVARADPLPWALCGSWTSRDKYGSLQSGLKLLPSLSLPRKHNSLDFNPSFLVIFCKSSKRISGFQATRCLRRWFCEGMDRNIFLEPPAALLSDLQGIQLLGVSAHQPLPKQLLRTLVSASQIWESNRHPREACSSILYGNRQPAEKNNFIRGKDYNLSSVCLAIRTNTGRFCSSQTSLPCVHPPALLVRQSLATLVKKKSHTKS